MMEWYCQFKSLDDYKSYLQNKSEDVKEEEAWREAKTIKALEAYLAQYPKGKYAKQAKEKIEDLRWKNVKLKNTIESYQNYINKYPNGKYIREAKSNIEYLVWDSTKKNNTVDAYENYLKNYPTGEYAQQAKEAIEEILDEVLFWEKAKKINTIKAYEEYLNKYMRFEREANRKIEDFIWDDAKKQNTISAYQRYLNKYPKGLYKPFVDRNIQRIRNQRIRNQSFINKFNSALDNENFIVEALDNIFLIIVTFGIPFIIFVFIRYKYHYPDFENQIFNIFGLAVMGFLSSTAFLFPFLGVWQIIYNIRKKIPFLKNPFFAYIFLSILALSLILGFFFGLWIVISMK